ncbi:signal recognition particle receptor beta subunit-domain-containing protein [Dichotomocladium elegans]|nr:signal recognition particle receptor beta subunit-domain-containing protein [Dichotomocladium elegans]
MLLPTWLSLTALAALVVALIAVVIAVFLKQKSAKNTILLLGISDAGKTALYTRLRYGKFVPTVTSMKENEGPLVVGSKTFDLVDIPGHERVRLRYTEFLPVTRSIVFLVDSTTIARQVREVGEYLYNVLAERKVQQQSIPVLIVCNKADMITALPKEKIIQRLEAEMNRLRSTRTAAVEKQATDGNEEQEAFLGYEGEDFHLDQLDNDVQFEVCSVEKDELDAVMDFIAH